MWAGVNVPCGAVFQFALPSLPTMHGDPLPLQADATVAPRAFGAMQHRGLLLDLTGSHD